jgi:hypothetical protein
LLQRAILFCFSIEKLFLGGSAYGASAFAGTAGDASVCVDHILAFAFRDSVYGALFNASTAHYTFVRNLVCHYSTPPKLCDSIIHPKARKSNMLVLPNLLLFP